MFSIIQKNAVIKCFKTFKQLRNRLSSHEAQELNHNVVVHNMTHSITAETLRNQVKSTGL